MYHMAYVQYLITMFVSLNRLTVLHKSHIFEPLGKKYIWILIIAIYFSPFLNTNVVFHYQAETTCLENVDQYSLVSSQMPVLDIFSVLIPFMVITMAITIMFNIANQNLLQIEPYSPKSLLSDSVRSTNQASLCLTRQYLLRYSESVTCLKAQKALSPATKFLAGYISLKFVLTMFYHMAYVQYSISALISFNRLSVLLSFNIFEPIWNKFLWVMILLIYCVPFLNTHIVYDYDVYIVYVEKDDSFSVLAPGLPVDKIYAVLIPYMFFTTLLCVICNAASVIFLRSLSIQRKKAESNFLVIMSIIIRLLWISVCYSLFSNILCYQN
ncbi:Protein CBG23121 [Caenorhabditis briggsae]|uniref:Serpentine receptor class gamma n=1 Tax=Caenorhabditis briggsae TaxID=6238 RepID=A8Y4N2_CAEBR|nr:Protein CBG23121 [Caenorhabditis briggsae]CAP39852.1 Protein CBG23121 [Caenorhabditis briggsae]